MTWLYTIYKAEMFLSRLITLRIIKPKVAYKSKSAGSYNAWLIAVIKVQAVSLVGHPNWFYAKLDSPAHIRPWRRMFMQTRFVFHWFGTYDEASFTPMKWDCTFVTFESLVLLGGVVWLHFSPVSFVGFSLQWIYWPCPMWKVISLMC